MTTIAYRDGIMAADTGISTSYGGRVGFVSKLAKGPDGAIGGACGRAVWWSAFQAWLKAGRYGSMPEQKEGDTALVVEADGTLRLYQDNGSCVVRGPYFAIGSGCSEALGAMHAGATAVRAVDAAKAHDDGTFGDVETLP